MPKLVTAVIKPFKLDEVKEALQGAGVARHDGDRDAGRRPPGRPHRGLPGGRVQVDFQPKVRVEVLAEDRASAVRISEVVTGAARTGKIGDGKVWISDIDQLIRIRTGEKGDELAGSDRLACSRRPTRSCTRLSTELTWPA